MRGQIRVVITLWHAGFKTGSAQGRNTGAIVGACAFAKLRQSNVSFVMSVCLSAWNSSASTGRIFLKFLRIFRKSVDKIQVSLKSDKNNWHFT
jgi:hypothetical protein